MEEEYEGVTLTIFPDDWPDGLYGLKIEAQNVYIENGMVKVYGDPIWKLDGDSSG